MKYRLIPILFVWKVVIVDVSTHIMFQIILTYPILSLSQYLIADEFHVKWGFWYLLSVIYYILSLKDFASTRILALGNFVLKPYGHFKLKEHWGFLPACFADDVRSQRILLATYYANVPNLKDDITVQRSLS